MKTLTGKLAALFSALLAVVGVAGAIGYGDLAPDFTLVDSDGRTHTLSQYRGEVVYLSFFGWS